MEKDLRKYLEEYRKYTIELTECIYKEEYDSLEDLFNKRQKILDELSNLNFVNQEVSMISKELGLLTYDEKLGAAMLEKRDKVKQSIARLIQGKNANNGYNIGPHKALVFSKKI
ncbi:MAG: flagellar protein FliT [Bacillota bacterium]|nr:flagellar protein FliT [Bacillota bacterium]